jgi:hypothetical protein
MSGLRAGRAKNAAPEMDKRFGWFAWERWKIAGEAHPKKENDHRSHEKRNAECCENWCCV